MFALLGTVCGATFVWLATQRNDTASTIALVCIGCIVFSACARTGLVAARGGVNVRRRAIGATILVLSTIASIVYFGASTVDAHWFGGGFTHGPTTRNEVALTFDDGPNITATLGVMKILDARHVHATFFVVGKALDAQPEIVRELIANGHLVGNHSYNHDQWRWLDPRYQELEKTQRVFARHQLNCPNWFRPPHGQRTPFIRRVVDGHHMHMALWDVSASDWNTVDAHLIAQRVLRKVHPGAIILLHDGLDGIATRNRTVMLAALPEILDGLAAKGLKPVTLDAMFGTSGAGRC